MKALLIASLVSSFYVTQMIHTDFLKELIDRNFEHIQTFIIVAVIHIVLLVFLSIKLFRKKQRKLADGELLSWKDLKAEQDTQEAKGSFHTRNQRSFRKDKSGILISRNLKLSTKKSYEHVLLLGPTGSGKSAQFFKPSLRTIDNTSLIVTDPKGELHRDTKDFLEAKGYRVLHINFNTDPDEEVFSHNYSLLGNCTDDSSVRKIGDSILANTEGEWGNLSKTLLLAFLFLERDMGEQSLNNVARNIGSFPDDLDELEAIFSASPEALLQFKQFRKTARGDGYVSSVYATIQSVMKVFEYDKVKQVDSKSDFSPGDLRTQKTALFLSYPTKDSKIYQPYLSSFYFQLISEIEAHPSMDESKPGKKGYGVVFYMDEFANIGIIPSFAEFLTTVRSKNMSFILGVQSIAQLKANYKDTFSILIENTKTRIALPGLIHETAKFFSDLVGEEEYNALSISSSAKSDVSTSESKQKKNVLSPDQIRRLPSNQLICVFNNLRPILDIVNYYYLDELDFKYKYEWKYPKFIATPLYKFLRKATPNGIQVEEERVKELAAKFKEKHEETKEKAHSISQKRISENPEERKEAQRIMKEEIQILKEEELKPQQPIKQQDQNEILNSIKNLRRR